MKINYASGVKLWEGLVDAFGVSTTSRNEQLVTINEQGEAILTVPLGRDIFMKIEGHKLEIRLVRTRYNKTNKILGSGVWKWNSERWNIPDNDRLVAEVIDAAAPLLQPLSNDYPHLGPLVSRAIDWVAELDAAAQARIQYHRDKDRRRSRIVSFWFSVLIIGFVLLFFYVVLEGDPNRCIYIPDPRGGYIDC